MWILADHLALAPMKIIRMRKTGLSFDPDKLPTIPSLTKTEEWDQQLFKEFCKKVEQAEVVIFAVLTGIDEPDCPNTLILASFWGEVLVTGIRELVQCTQETRMEMEGFAQLQEFFLQKDTAYVTEREDRSLAMMDKVGIATVTGLETWHPLGHEFSPSIAYVFTGLWGRLTVPFKGSTSAGWAWNQHDPEESTRQAPDQVRLAFATANAMATLTLDGVVARVDPEDDRALEGLGALVLKSEQEGILEGDETIGMRGLQLEEARNSEATVQGPRVPWLGLEMAWREPMGRIRRGGRREIPMERTTTVLPRQKETIEDVWSWEESISFVTLLGPEPRRPIEALAFTLPAAPKKSVLKEWDVSKIRRANDQLGTDPDNLDLARQRFAGLNVTGKTESTTRTSSPPPTPNVDVHGLWKEEKNRHVGERHQGPPRLRWNPHVRKETIGKRHRDPEDRVQVWEAEGDDETTLNYTWPPKSKKRREGEDSRGWNGGARRWSSTGGQTSYWTRRPPRGQRGPVSNGPGADVREAVTVRGRSGVRGRGRNFSERGRRGRRGSSIDWSMGSE